MAAIRRMQSSGLSPPGVSQKAGAIIALGAVGIASLGAVYAWKVSKRPAFDAPSSVLVPKKKPSKERRSRGKRHKARAQPANGSEGGAMHESSEEDVPTATDDAAADAADELAARERATAAAGRPMDVEPMQPAELEAAAAASRTSGESTPAAAAAAPAGDAESMTGAGLTTRAEGAEPSGETAEGQWIPVERKQRKGKKGAVVTASEALTGESEGAEDTKELLVPDADESPAQPEAAKPAAVTVVSTDDAPEVGTSTEPSPDASDEARRLRREAKKKRKAEQAAAKAESAAVASAAATAAAQAGPSSSAAKVPLARFAPPRTSWADDADEEEDGAYPRTSEASSSGLDEAATVAEQVAAKLDAAERDADAAAMSARCAEHEAPVEWVEVKKRGGRGKK